MKAYLNKPQRYISLVLISFQIRVILCQDLSIYGQYVLATTAVTSRTTNLVYAKCFQGLGFTTCTPSIADDDETANNLAYYDNLGSLVGGNYCLQCCGGTENDRVDVWDLSCPVTAANVNQVNLYGYELRIARNKSSKDREIVWCPVRRSACKYLEDGKLNGSVVTACDRSKDKSHIIAITVTLTVQEYNAQFSYWNGVSSCNVEVEESNQTLVGGNSYIFKEKLILIHNVVPENQQAFDIIKVLIILVACIVFVYLMLYCCRRKHCVYCGQKLVMNFTLCYKCVLVGAEPPDPVMMKALELKSQELQGTIPGQFPGSQCVVAFVRGWYRYFCKCGRKDYTVTKVLPEETLATNSEEGSLYKASKDALNEESKDGILETPKKKKKKPLANPRINPSIKMVPPPVIDTTTTESKVICGKKGQRGTAAAPKEKHRNPNILDYPDDLIYRAVAVPGYPLKSASP